MENKIGSSDHDSSMKKDGNGQSRANSHEFSANAQGSSAGYSASAQTGQAGKSGKAGQYAGSQANKAQSGISGEFHSFISDIEEFITSNTSLTGEDWAQAKAKLNARIASAKESVQEMSGAVVERARTTARATDGYVRENPWKAIGVMAALGCLVGVIAARRR
ncbi:MAG: DUF883 domain-containing protein [Gammaproteobacteria bacterium]|nr:DUF883 domain-containing protein [Gammaproteobacteria bacterium]